MNSSNIRADLAGLAVGLLVSTGASTARSTVRYSRRSFKEKMKAYVLPLALGIIFAAPVAAYGAERANRPIHSHRAINYRLAVLDYAPLAARFLDAKAQVLPAARSWPVFGGPETDGLSRDPEECVRHGCVDAGGG